MSGVSDLPFQFLSGFIATVIPLLFVVLMIDDAGSRRIILYFCWGTFAGVLAYNLNNYFGSVWGQTQRMTLAIAPMIEEVCKGLPVLLFLNTKKYTRVTKLIVFCALASGVGFSIQESTFYFAISSRELVDIVALVVRTLTTALMHGMTTAAFGIGLLLFSKHKHIIIPLIFGLFSLCASIHALFNLLLSTQLAFISMIMPIAMFGAGLFFIRKQGND